jgi:hypothetical protein
MKIISLLEILEKNNIINIIFNLDEDSSLYEEIILEKYLDYNRGNNE